MQVQLAKLQKNDENNRQNQGEEIPAGFKNAKINKKEAEIILRTLNEDEKRLQKQLKNKNVPAAPGNRKKW